MLRRHSFVRWFHLGALSIVSLSSCTSGGEARQGDARRRVAVEHGGRARDLLAVLAALALEQVVCLRGETLTRVSVQRRTNERVGEGRASQSASL